MLHEKYDYPMMNLHGITLQYGFDLRVTMQPEVIITDEDVRGVKVNQRDCLFDDEVEQKAADFKLVVKCHFYCRNDPHGRCNIVLYRVLRST